MSGTQRGASTGRLLGHTQQLYPTGEELQPGPDSASLSHQLGRWCLCHPISQKSKLRQSHSLLSHAHSCQALPRTVPG